ncbi:MAG: endonuclease III [Alphaproteobacteria bacterium]|nr:endonuclease III [Alphaproteobacteria bacterium]
MTTKQRNIFFQELQKAYPNPECELNWTNHFSLLVAIILSAQTTDRNVNKVTHILFQVADTPYAILELGEEKLKTYLKTINYFNNKTKSIIRLADIIVNQYNGLVPSDFETLVTLPGVGRKTANVFLNIAFHAPSIGVDTHVFRLCHRLNICTGKTPEEIEKKLNELVPNDYKSDVGLALVLHGRYVCTARRPLCEKCPIYHVCLSTDKKDLTALNKEDLK